MIWHTPSNTLNTVHVYDGQNEDAIKAYVESNQSPMNHPCLLEPKNYARNLNITFNKEHITKMEHWFTEFCHQITVNASLKYTNTFLFELDGFVTFSNLRIGHMEIV